MALASFSISFSFADTSDKPGTAAQVIKSTYLRAAPDEKAQNIGEVPKGAIVILQGERKNGFVQILVELEGETSVEGWVPVGDLNYRAREGVKVEEEIQPKGGEPPPFGRPVEKKRSLVPKDEGVLLTRFKTFLYGFEAGAGLSVLEPSKGTYLGPGFHFSAEVGYFLLRQMPIRFHLGYSLVTGTEADGSAISLGFVDAHVVLAYLFDRFEIFGGAQYALGVGIGDLPTFVTVAEAYDFSNVCFLVGAGYHFPLTEHAELVVRGRYGVSLFGNPLFMQTIAGFLALEIKG